MSDSKDLQLLPDIHAYLETIRTEDSVSSKGLEELIFKIRSITGLSEETCSDIISLFFEEIRNGILRGEIIELRGFGKFYVACPKNKITKNRVVARFRPAPLLIKKLNEND